MRRLLPDPAGTELDDTQLTAAYRLPPGRHVRVNFIASLDGAVAVDGRSRALGSPADLRVFRLLRALADVVLVGHGTASAEGYGPITAGSPVGRLRVALGRPATAPIAVVSRRASLDPTAELVTATGAHTVLITCAAADLDRRAALADAGAEVLVCGEEDVDLVLALDQLAERGFEQVLCEGGPQLFRAALQADAVDELALSIAPALVGGSTRLLDDALPDVLQPQLRQLLEEDGMLCARYAVPRSG